MMRPFMSLHGREADDVMKRIEEIDRNFATDRIDTSGMAFYDVREEPFRLYGLYEPRAHGAFRRMPEDVARAASEGVFSLHTHTAGGRIRFRTDSRRIILRCDMPAIHHMDHMPLTGSSCFDLYADGCFVNTFRMTLGEHGRVADHDGAEDGYASMLTFRTAGMHDVVIHFPLYDEVSRVHIGLETDARLEPGARYAVEKPVVYYGSSITQGGCASHAGNSYQAILSRRLDCDHINLGFSGNCKGEDVMAEYIAGLDMSVFVYDYDHNAPNPAHLAATHERVFRIIRERQPELPVVMLSKVDGQTDADTATRRGIIRRTYENALAAGDKHVYFIDGQTAFAQVGPALCTVDGTHPNDLGFWCMANMLEETLRSFVR